MQLRAVHIDLNTGNSREERVSLRGAPGPVAYAAGLKGDPLVIGVGPLGDLEIPGANRLVIAGRSPAWGAFFTSTLGSAGASLRALDIDFLVLRGRAPRISALVVSSTGTRLHPFDPAPSTYTVLGTVLRAGWTEERAPRVLATGPAAATTRMGAIASAVPVSGQPIVLETWAGRGGFGSRMVQLHALAAIVFDAPADAGRVKRRTTEQMRSGTKKYRYHPLLQTGGTLGSNLATLREKLLAFNTRSMYWEPALRNDIHERFVEGRYLKQFNDSTHNGRKGRDCGETCPAVCKKVAGGFKKDYQPYAAMGPHIGVFDQEAAEHAADTADTLGFDAVEAGAISGWALDCLADGTLSPSDFGIDDVPHWDLQVFDPDADSFHNAHLAAHLLHNVALAENPTPLVRALRAGLRSGAALTSESARQRAAYSAHGAGGSMAPNHYWTPGIVAPVPMPGKYYTDYSLEFAEPRELGRRSATRLVRELALDNLGMCRFQREWAEDQLPDLVAGKDPDTKTEDVWAAHESIARTIAHRTTPIFWETDRTIDRVSTYLEEARRDYGSNDAIKGWVGAFRDDRRGAARRYWNEFRSGLFEALG